ncbi:predicted protein [Plenodomus lingam JN3]|uniref:Predicted protein n=1 Tax=Leptosphaeria maculans (strain JN3 / isolate v23.1.3 / race Av1-4-5-6-7-8) TaxID=985895 RepID=E4ZZ25_LEPMJ|nr:predicted protein [Plenodomus lingam JN3]CBX96460.1 predicted protein [Plenodomus lingam JN3]
MASCHHSSTDIAYNGTYTDPTLRIVQDRTSSLPRVSLLPLCLVPAWIAGPSAFASFRQAVHTDAKEKHTKNNGSKASG